MDLLNHSANLRLIKYHGLGNDFLLLDRLEPGPPVTGETVRAACDRRRGIGADGLIVVLPGSGGADLAMELYNADGSRAEMSGNGIRCLALFAHQAGLVDGRSFVVATDAGPRSVSIVAGGGPGPALVSVDMGEVRVGPADEQVRVAGGAGGSVGAGRAGGARAWRGRLVDAGNPHLVLVEDDLEHLALDDLGPALEASRPGGVNVEWVRPGPGPDELDLRVWERGAGATLACGTGSAAAAAAAIAMGLVPGPGVTVRNPGGPLEAACTGGRVVLTGPAERIGTAEIDRGQP